VRARGCDVRRQSDGCTTVAATNGTPVGGRNVEGIVRAQAAQRRLCGGRLVTHAPVTAWPPHVERQRLGNRAQGCWRRPTGRWRQGGRRCQRSRMQLIDSVEAWRKALRTERSAGRSIGLVPTMGALHAGHTSLIARAVAECDVVGVSVFVNPLQFGAQEDLAAYPRTFATDVELAEAGGAAYVFAPSTAEMFPGAGSWRPGRRPLATVVSVPSLSARWEGESRPGHFDGVATVVAKLLAQAGPCRAYFGEKDFQQLCIVRRMALDLDLGVDVVGCTTVREPDGLALSSRNAYLTAAERAVAPVLHRALTAGAAEVGAGAPPEVARGVMHDMVAAEPAMSLIYGEVVDPGSLERLDADLVRGGSARLLIAARLGRARLIDNVEVTR